ncbi:MAG: M28 family peptidase [Ignavibacteriales bacterium]|nr:M28 family peptidase [Ignavibacteriales bacterium]
MKNSIKLLLPLVLGMFTYAQAQTPFSSDSAQAYLKTIAVDIGPRPMGSRNERRVIDFALQKFREFGLQEAYLIPMTETNGSSISPSKNTTSGIAVGVLKGTGDSIIVIGAHIDSEGPEIPGANDDGSGSAVVIELARVLSKRENQSTLVFALFGGEEQGLLGSKYFVKTFSDMQRVVLMLQVDMANGSEWLVPTLDADTHSAPTWLVQASYEEFYKLGYTGLSFPTHFYTLNSIIPGGGAGSDHEAFLEKKIPAIDFTSDPTDPIHTPQDSYENFKPAGLKRSGDLIYKLVERFDGGVPEEKIGQYYLFQIGTHPFFIPLWVLSTFIVVAIILAVIAVLDARKRRPQTHDAQPAKIPGLKLFLLMLIIQTCVWLSENVVGIIKGVRYPWLAEPDGYWVLAFLAGCLGIWLSLQLTPKLKFRKDSYSYFLRAVIALTLLIALTSLLSPKLALYPAMGLFFLALAMIVRSAPLKFLFWILSPHFMFRLFFSEGFDFIARLVTLTSSVTIFISFVIHVAYIIFFSLWAFPFLLGFAAVYFDSQADLLWLKRFRSKWGIITCGGAFVIMALVLVTRPTFSQYWKQKIWLEQTYDANSNKGSAIIKSSDYLNNVRLRFGDKDTLIAGRTLSMKLKDIGVPSEPWVSVERTMESSVKDTNTSFNILVKLRTRFRPLSLNLHFSAGNHNLVDITTPFAYSSTGKSVSLHWYSFPDTSLIIPIHFTVIGADSVTESIEAIFVEELEPITVEKEMASVIRRTRLTQSAILKEK